MEFSIHRDHSEIEADQWNALLGRSVLDVPFLRHEYQRTWWEHRGGGEWPDAELLLICARREERLIGVAPLFAAEHDGRRALLLAGSIEISDYLDLIVADADLPDFVSGLCGLLAERDPVSWRALDWYNVPESSPTLAVLRSEAGRRGWSYSQEVYRPTPYIPLSGDFDSYLAGLEKKKRHEIRRKMRRLYEGGRSVRWYVSDGQHLEAEMDRLFELMASDHEKAQFLTAEMREQLRHVADAAHLAGWLWLAFLEVDGQLAAASLNFDFGNRLWGYNSGVNSEFRELSPGWVLLSHILQWAGEHGRDEFDFMRGDEDYKYRFGAIDRYVVRATTLGA